MWEQFSTRLASWVNVTNPPVIVTMAAQWDIAYCTTRRLSKVLELQYSESVLYFSAHYSNNWRF